MTRIQPQADFNSKPEEKWPKKYSSKKKKKKKRCKMATLKQDILGSCTDV